MKTTDEQIEKMAEDYDNQNDFYCSSMCEYSTPTKVVVSIYKAGFKACEAKMLAEASEGFKDWADDYFDLPLDKLSPHFKEAFTAGAMSQVKHNHHKIDIRSCMCSRYEDKIKELETEIEELKNAVEWYKE